LSSKLESLLLLYRLSAETRSKLESLLDIFRGINQMSLKTRQNPETGALEVFVNEQWVRFEEYRQRQIAEAYENSIKFLRDRLGEDFEERIRNQEPEAGSERDS